MSRDHQQVWIGLVEVGALSWNTGFLEDGFFVIGFDDIEPFVDRRNRCDLDADLIERAEDAEISRTVQYGPFFAYKNTDA